jgi:hypothetical protein
LGTKALIGRSITQELDIDGHAEGNVKDINYALTIDNRPGHKDVDGDPTLSLQDLQLPSNTGEKWTDDWEYLTVGAKSSTSFGTGLSFTYRYKSNFAWRLFVDYDYSKKNFTMKYDPYHYLKDGLTENAFNMVQFVSDYSNYLDPIEFRKTKKMNYYTIGMSFMINI